MSLKDWKNRPFNLYFLVLFTFLSLYGFTCAPGALWQDSGEFHYRVWLNDISDHDDLVRCHPLYIVICLITKLIPGGNFAGKINLVSSLFGSITIANLFYLVRLWTSSNKAAFTSAISLGLAWTFWQHATIAEVYTLYTAILSAELIFLFLYLRSSNCLYLYTLFFLNGLSISNHIFGIFPLAAYIFLILHFLVKQDLKLREVALSVLAWAVGNALYLFYIFKLSVATGSLILALKSATVGEYQSQITNFSLSGRVVLENFGFLLYNFCSPVILLIFLGIYLWRSIPTPKYFSLICLWIMGVFFFFAFRYNVPDRYAFFIPFYLLSAVFIGLGAHRLFSYRLFNAAKVQFLIFFLIISGPIFFYWQIPIQLERIQFSLGTKRQMPFRNEYVYFLRPWQHTTTQAEQFARASLEATPPNAVILVDRIAYPPLWMAQAIDKLRPDVRVIMGGGPDINKSDIKNFANTGRLYVVSPIKSYCPEYLLDNYDFVKAGPIYHVISKKP
jgi:hypothetical protein